MDTEGTVREAGKKEASVSRTLLLRNRKNSQ